MAEITWTAEAQRWLEDIFEYIAADNPQAAAHTVNGIYQRAQELANFPEMGHRYWASNRHVRILLYGHYRIGATGGTFRGKLHAYGPSSGSGNPIVSLLPA